MGEVLVVRIPRGDSKGMKTDQSVAMSTGPHALVFTLESEYTKSAEKVTRVADWVK